MLKRYSTVEMTQNWNEEHRWRLVALVQTTVLRARVALGELSLAIPDSLPDSLKIDPAEIDRIESSGIGHDVIAFLMHISPQLPKKLRPWWHQKLTSYDPQDTALMLQIRSSIDILLSAFLELMPTLKRRAYEHKYAAQIGRTHGVHAEPITFGVKLANWYDELNRHVARLQALREQVSVGKISGAVGMYTLPPEVEKKVCEMLDLRPITATQIISRDIVAEYVTTLALIGGSIDKFCTALRLMQMTEVGEVQEYFDPKQRGSSAMPHKRNPIAGENLCGMSRVLRGYAVMALENQQTWHERSIDNSGPERIFLPDASQLAHYMVRRFTKVISKLLVYPKRMKQNLQLTKGLIFSQDVQALVARKSGLPRERAYKLVHKIAQRCWDTKADFYKALAADAKIMKHISADELKACFSLQAKLQHVDTIFDRIFNPKED